MGAPGGGTTSAPNRDDAETAVHRLNRHLTCLRDAMLLSATGEFNTPYQHTLSTHPVNTFYQHTLSTYPLNISLSTPIHAILLSSSLFLLLSPSPSPPSSASPPLLSLPLTPFLPPIPGDAVAAVLAPAATLAPRLLLRCLRQVFAEFIAAAHIQMTMTTTTMTNAHTAGDTTATLATSSGSVSGRDHRGAGGGWKTFTGDAGTGSGSGAGSGSFGGGFLDRYDNPYAIDPALYPSSYSSSYAPSSSFPSSSSSKGLDYANANHTNSTNYTNYSSSTTPGDPCGPLLLPLSYPPNLALVLDPPPATMIYF